MSISRTGKWDDLAGFRAERNRLWVESGTLDSGETRPEFGWVREGLTLAQEVCQFSK